MKEEELKLLQIQVKFPEFARKRILSGYSQRQLARKAGLSSAFLSQIESGKRNIRSGPAIRICKELGAGFDELFEIVETRKTTSAPLEDQ